MIILDCCAGIEIARNSSRGKDLMELLMPQEKIISPDFYRIEATNVAWKYARTGTFNKEQAKTLMHDAISIPDFYADCTDMTDEVLSLADATGHSAYDCYYVVLARRNDATLFTLDQKLQKLCGELRVNCLQDIYL